jgi:magnesium transporter
MLRNSVIKADGTMSELTRKRSTKSGLPPGTLIHIGEKKTEEVKITIIDYDETHFQEKEVKTIEECFPFKEKPTVTWINIDGLHQIDIIEKLGKHFGFHPLVLEDIVNTDQRPKIEDFVTYLFLVLKMLTYHTRENDVVSEQLSLILGPNFLISFQEYPGDNFEPIRERIRSSKGRIRQMDVDYLAYTLLDSIIDNYFFILEQIGDKIEEIEDALVTDPKPETLQILHNLKREMIVIRKSIWPLREVINRLERWETPLIQKATTIYLRDVYDHTIQVIDTIETYRDMLSGMLDIYLSSVSNRMNEVMKVLTIIATIFIPLTFIAGIYGMNFNMPELQWPWAYPYMFYFILIVIGLIMLTYFRRKKWL